MLLRPVRIQERSRKEGHLVADGQAAANVKKIFRMKLEGMSPQSIADELNRLGEPCPGLYKLENGIRFAMPFAGGDRPKWGPNTVMRILSNEIYTGTMVQGRTYTPSFRSRKTLPRAREEWFRKEGTHRALVSRHEFEVVQDLVAGTPGPPRIEEGRLFSGLVYCAECGQQMLIRTGAQREPLPHLLDQQARQGGCSSHLFNEERLKGIVSRGRRGAGRHERRLRPVRRGSPRGARP